MGNQILTGLDLLRAREQLKIENRRAEEQQEIENVQAQKDQSLREKEQKRRQDITDLRLKTDTQAENLRNLQGKLAAKTGQAFGFTPTEGTFRLPEVSDDSMGPRFGGTPETFDTTGQVENFGGNPFQSEQEAQQLREGALAQIQFNLLQKEAEARASATFRSTQERVKGAVEVKKLDIKARELAAQQKFKDTEAHLRLKSKLRVGIKKFVIDYGSQAKIALDRHLNTMGSSEFESAGTMGFFGLSDVPNPGTKQFAQVNLATQSAGLRFAIDNNLDPRNGGKSYLALDNSVVKGLRENSMPLLNVITNSRKRFQDLKDADFVFDTSLAAKARLTAEEIRDFFAGSEILRIMDSLVGDAAAVAKSVGEERVTEADATRALGQMIKAGTNRTVMTEIFTELLRRVRNTIDADFGGIGPTQIVGILGKAATDALGQNAFRDDTQIDLEGNIVPNSSFGTPGATLDRNERTVTVGTTKYRIFTNAKGEDKVLENLGPVGSQ